MLGWLFLDFFYEKFQLLGDQKYSLLSNQATYLIFSDLTEPQLSSLLYLETFSKFLSSIEGQKPEHTSLNLREKLRNISTYDRSKIISTLSTYGVVHNFLIRFSLILKIPKLLRFKKTTWFVTVRQTDEVN